MHESERPPTGTVNRSLKPLAEVVWDMFDNVSFEV